MALLVGVPEALEINQEYLVAFNGLRACSRSFAGDEAIVSVGKNDN